MSTKISPPSQPLPAAQFEPATLVELLRWRARDQPERLAYTYLSGGANSEASYTYREMDGRCRSIAAALQRFGAAGERALLLYPPGLEYIAAFLGCLYAGVVAVPAYPPDPKRLHRVLPRLQAIVKDAQASFALGTSEILSVLRPAFAADPNLQAIRWLATDTLEEGLADNWLDPGSDGNTLAFLQYTSGSTSEPKGVMVSQGNLIHNESMIKAAFGASEESTFVGWLPLYHDMGLIGNVLQPLYLGSRCIMMSPETFLQKPLTWLQAISRYGGHLGGAPNFAYDLCVRKISPEEKETLDLSSWKVAFNGAEPVNHETMERFTKSFAPCGFRREAFYPCYGLAEATLLVSGGEHAKPPVVRRFRAQSLEEKRAIVATDNQEPGRSLVGCGHGWLGQKIIIVDPESRVVCEPDQIGEIWVSGSSVAQGYFNRPEETQRTFQAALADTGEGPFLRTGDLGCLRDGELFIAGRLKDLIIIRGRNHYPQDIEKTVEKAHPGLRAGCGAAFSVNRDGEEHLVVVQEVERNFAPANAQTAAQAVRRAIAEIHELQAPTVVLIKTNTIRKTSSGKIQRHACRNDYLGGRLDTVDASVIESDPPVADERLTREALAALNPEERGERLIAALKRQVAEISGLNYSLIDEHQPLVACGVDSLMAFELPSRLETSFGVAVQAVSLLDGMTISQLAVGLLKQLHPTDAEQAGHADGKAMGASLPLPPIRRQLGRGLSFDQERMWFLDQLSPASSAYHLPRAWRIKGGLQVAALEQSFNEIIRRHEVLRTTFPTIAGRPAAQVQSQAGVRVSTVDLSGLADREAEAERAIAQAAQRPFDLANGPLIRITLIRLNDAEQVAVMVVHHIVCDVQSMNILTGELQALYAVFCAGARANLAALAIQYADFAGWQRDWLEGQWLQTQLGYWQQELAGSPPRLELPTDRPRPAVQTFPAAALAFDIPASLIKSLRELSRQEGVTLFMTLATAFKVLLHLYSGQKDILIGAPVLGRSHQETEKLAGFFAYPLILRTDLSGDPVVRELLARVRRSALGAYAHQHAPLAKVLEACQPERSSQYHPLFQVMLSFMDEPEELLALPGLGVEPIDLGRGMSDVELFVTLVRRKDSLHGIAEYNTDLFDADTVEQLLGAYQEILTTFASHLESRLSQLSLAQPLLEKARAARRWESKQTLAIAANFTIEPMAESLKFWARELEAASTIEFAPYNQVFQQLLDPSGLLAQNSSGLNVVVVRLEDWRKQETRTSPFCSSSDGDEVEHNVSSFVSALISVAGNSPVPYLVLVCPNSPRTAADPASAGFFNRMEAMMARELKSASGVYLVSSAELAATYPVSDYYDPHTDELGHIPYTEAFYAALGTMVMRRAHTLNRPPYKVIVLDCDQTLWKGVCAEDGVEGIEVDASRQLLQQAMVTQHHSGKLICLCSKNNAEDVLEVFQRRADMVLKPEHIVSQRINWAAKSDNLKSLAEELQLGLDSFIFIDDDLVSCMEVEANCPEALVLQLPENPGEIPKFLRHIWAFDCLQRTDEDSRRAQLYKENRARQRLFGESLTFAGFIAGLGLEVTITPMEPEDAARVSQLTARTNQFNLTGRNRTAGEISRLSDSGKACMIVKARDRFGDYGLVAVTIFEAGSSVLTVETFLLSCRAMGRGIEHRMLAKLGEVACQRGINDLEIVYLATGKNQPGLDFIGTLGAQTSVPAGEEKRFRLRAETAAATIWNAGDVRPSAASEHRARQAKPSTSPQVNSARMRWIADQLSDAQEILLAMRADKRMRPWLQTAFAPPRTPTERKLAAICAELLGMDQVGIHDSFFELGGHSLLATQLISRVREAFQIDLPINELFNNTPTVARLAESVVQHQITRISADEMAAMLSELNGLSDEQVQALLAAETYIA